MPDTESERSERQGGPSALQGRSVIGTHSLSGEKGGVSLPPYSPPLQDRTAGESFARVSLRALRSNVSGNSGYGLDDRLVRSLPWVFRRGCGFPSGGW